MRGWICCPFILLHLLKVDCGTTKLVCEVKTAPVQPVYKLQRTFTDAFTYVKDSQCLSESGGPGTHNLSFFSVSCCLMHPTTVTQASELSRSTPVFPSHWQTGLVGTLVHTDFRMPTRTRQVHGAKFQKTPGYCYF